MATRLSAAQRLELQQVSEREIQRYAGDHALWHRHVHNVELDPVQILKMAQMDECPNTIDCSCRRTGKTAVKELWLLEYLATHSDQELGVVAPREAQSITNLAYHTDAIRRSAILENFLLYKGGRKQLADASYQFSNRSTASAYGIMAQVDGSDLTVASLEEVDDMPPDRLYSRFLLTMGATRRLGATSNAVNDPIIRITGVFKGADTLASMIDSGKYSLLPVVDCHMGVELGILNEQFIEDMRDQLSPEEYLRQLLCRNVAARNLIWDSWLQKAKVRGSSAQLSIQEPIPGVQRKKKGLVSFGYDASGHGEDPAASRHALVVGEELSGYVVPIYCRTWSPGTDEASVMQDLVSLWRFFQPDYALGDAYGVGMITACCDRLFVEGLTPIDRRAIGGGESTASTWPEWPFSPIRFEGMTKHMMASAVRSLFNNGRVAIPAVDNDPSTAPVMADMQLLCRQLTNIKAQPTKGAYASYRMVKRNVGDDLFDAFMAMTWALATRGESQAQLVVASRSQTRAQLMGRSPLGFLGLL